MEGKGQDAITVLSWYLSGRDVKNHKKTVMITGDNWCPVRGLNLKIPFHYFRTSCNTSSEDIIHYEHNSTYRR